MNLIRKTAKLLTLPIPNKEKRKSAREKTEKFLHMLFNTEYYRCDQIYQKICQENKSIGFDKYHLVSLGYNCFGRMTFNYWGLKPRKADGEKTMPFDISVHPLNAIIDVLENHFSDYLDDIVYSEKDNCWINKKYNISFVHDHENDKALFIERYKTRIANFYDVIEDKTPTLFFCYTDKEPDITAINKLSSTLSDLCVHKRHKLVYMVFNHAIPEGVDNNVSLYQANYPQGYVHMDVKNKYNTSGQSFESGVVEFMRNEILRVLNRK